MVKLGRLRVLVAALSLLLATPALAGADDPVTIDAIIPLTGPSAYSGQIHATALKAYESLANATGGIRGRPVHFEIHDDRSSPVIAVQLVSELMAKNPPLIMGSTYIAGCAAEEPLVRNGPVEFCFSPGLVTTQHNVFASSVANTYIIPATLKFIRERKYARVALISATDASGTVADRIALAALARPENKSLTAVDYEHFNPADISVSAQTARMPPARHSARYCERSTMQGSTCRS
jgi:branched-chain amino acid transport system substrate-binding protein